MGQWDNVVNVTCTIVSIVFFMTLASILLIPFFTRKVKNDAQKFFDSLPELDDLVRLVNGTIPESFFESNTSKIRFLTVSKKICWDANNNIPPLQDDCLLGAYYIVTTPGDTILGIHGGPNDLWYLGTQLVCTAGGWIKIEPDNLEYPFDMNVPGGIAGLDPSGLLFPWQIPFLFLQGMSFFGGWDANLNNPTLFSGLCINGDVYVVTVAGNTILDGQGNWEIGEALVCDGVNSMIPFWKKVTGMFFSLSEVLTSGSNTDPGGSIIMGSSPILASASMPKSLSFNMPSYTDCVIGGCQQTVIATDGKGHLYGYGVIPVGENTLHVSSTSITNSFSIIVDWFGNPASVNWDLLSIKPWNSPATPVDDLTHPNNQQTHSFNFDHGVVALNLNPSKSWLLNGGHAQVWRTVNYRAMGIMVTSSFTLSPNQNAAFGPIFRIRVNNFKPGPYWVRGMSMRVSPVAVPNALAQQDIVWSFLNERNFAMPCNDLGIEHTNVAGQVLITIKCWPIRFRKTSPTVDHNRIISIAIQIRHMVLST